MAEKQHKILTELEQEQVTLQQEEPGFLLCVVEGCNTGTWLEQNSLDALRAVLPYVNEYQTCFFLKCISFLLSLLLYSFLFLLCLGRNTAPAKSLQGSPSRKEAFTKAAERNLNDAAFNSTAPGRAA